MTKKTKEKKKSDATEKKQVKSENALRNELEQVKTELKNQKEKLLRCYADFDNYKKRIIKEEATKELHIKKKYLSELLDIKEILLKALDDKDPKEGLRLILNQLEQFFESENIKYIECIDKPFDHQLHHAVTTVERNDTEDNIIIEEIKKGYLVEDCVLRPSHVIVSKRKSEEEEINE